jgi:glycosyltransferase involved in cell wall biosynthesis
MRILYISQYFPPEMGAPAARVLELSRAWARRGHEVTVLTAFPHHPTGVIPPGYRRKVLMREKIEGIEVIRTWVYATANRGFLKRTLSYLSFMVSSVLLGLPLLRRRYDVVIATSPQFFVAVAGCVISTLLRRPFIFELRDLWPESIVAVGALRNRGVIRVLEGIEMMLYRRARAVCAVADSYVDVLARRGVRREKVFVVKNGADLERFRPRPKSAAAGVIEEFDLEGKFVCCYIGTIGMAHGLDIVLDAAARTTGDAGLVYLLVGEGARRGELESKAKERGLSNVIFTGQQPRERVVEFLAASDAVLVHLRKTELFEKVIPSKIFEIMGCGRPIILGVAGEAAGIIREAGSGVAIEPENVEEFLAAVESLRADTGKGTSMGRSGRAFVEANFDRERLAEDYLVRLGDLGT